MSISNPGIGYVCDDKGTQYYDDQYITSWEFCKDLYFPEYPLENVLQLPKQSTKSPHVAAMNAIYEFIDILADDSDVERIFGDVNNSKREEVLEMLTQAKNGQNIAALKNWMPAYSVFQNDDSKVLKINDSFDIITEDGLGGDDLMGAYKENAIYMSSTLFHSADKINLTECTAAQQIAHHIDEHIALNNGSNEKSIGSEGLLAALRICDEDTFNQLTQDQIKALKKNLIFANIEMNDTIVVDNAELSFWGFAGPVTFLVVSREEALAGEELFNQPIMVAGESIDLEKLQFIVDFFKSNPHVSTSKAIRVSGKEAIASVEGLYHVKEGIPVVQFYSGGSLDGDAVSLRENCGTINSGSCDIIPNVQSLRVKDGYTVKICGKHTGNNTFCESFESTINLSLYPKIQIIESVELEQIDYSQAIKMGLLMGYLCDGNKSSYPIHTRLDELHKNNKDCPLTTMYEQFIDMQTLALEEEFTGWTFLNPFGAPSEMYQDTKCLNINGSEVRCFNNDGSIKKESLTYKDWNGSAYTPANVSTSHESLVVFQHENRGNLKQGHLYYMEIKQSIGDNNAEHTMKSVHSGCGNNCNSSPLADVHVIGNVSKINDKRYFMNRCRMKPDTTRIKNASIKDILALSTGSVNDSLSYFQSSCNLSIEAIRNLEGMAGDDKSHAWAHFGMSLVHGVEFMAIAGGAVVTGGALAGIAGSLASVAVEGLGVAAETITAISSALTGTGALVADAADMTFTAMSIKSTIEHVNVLAHCIEISDQDCIGDQAANLVFDAFAMASVKSSLGQIHTIMEVPQEETLSTVVGQTRGARSFSYFKNEEISEEALQLAEEIESDGSHVSFEEMEDLNNVIRDCE